MIKLPQTLNLFADLVKVPFCDLRDFTAGAFSMLSHPKNRANLLQGKSEGFGLADEAQAMKVCVAVNAIARLLARRVWEQTAALVETNGLNVDTGRFC